MAVTYAEAMDPHVFEAGRKYELRPDTRDHVGRGGNRRLGPPRKAPWIPVVAVCDGLEGGKWMFHSGGASPWRVSYIPAQLLGIRRELVE